jgi:hypothetical protein
VKHNIVNVWQRPDAKSLGWPSAWYGIVPTQFWLDRHIEALMSGDTLMSSKQVFEQFNMPSATRHRLVKQGQIKTIRETPKGGMRFSKLDIVRFIETTGWKKGRRV